MFYIIKANGDKVAFDGSGLLSVSEDIDAAKTLTREDCGKSFKLKAAAGVEILLPAVFDGMRYRFTTGLAFATTDFTIVSTTNVIQGTAIVNGAHVAASNENTISFVASAESLGDYIDIESDGTNIYVSGSGVTAGSITFTAP
jgi:hypothetical protein